MLREGDLLLLHVYSNPEVYRLLANHTAPDQSSTLHLIDSHDTLFEMYAEPYDLFTIVKTTGW